MKKLIFIVGIILFSIILFNNFVFATDFLKVESYSIFIEILFILLAGIIGYVVGEIKSFREAKQKAYSELLPPILKMVYHRETTEDEKEFSKALSKLWLYGSKKVTQKMEHALKIMHNDINDDVTNALQKAVVEMRKDIQIWSWQKLKPEDVNHLYTLIAGAKNKKDKT